MQAVLTDVGEVFGCGRPYGGPSWRDSRRLGGGERKGEGRREKGEVRSVK
jgi:hypothetical protein